jgi:phosphate transport system ATP-binding protein
VTHGGHDGPEESPASEPVDHPEGPTHTAQLPNALAWPQPEDGPASGPEPANGPAPGGSAISRQASGSAPDEPAPDEPAPDGAAPDGAAPDGAAPGGGGTISWQVSGPPPRGAGGNHRADSRAPQPRPLLGIEARDVAAWFGDHKVLEGVSLTMEPGKVTALIGPSGCGKSTFLRILNRMHELVRTAALAGEVLLGGEDIYHPRQRPADVRRRIGMVFQKPNPFPAMSIYDNVASGLKLAGVRVHNRDQVVEASLRRAGLWNEVYRRLRSPGGALSGGQQQRLCIARSLAVSPEVLLMDEPCSALDPTSTRRIEETIRELADQVTIVIVTHNMQQAQRVSENCAFFLAAENTPGYIVESGPTEKVFEDPADPRTADYVHGRFG